jgi:uncharacterized protein
LTEGALRESSSVDGDRDSSATSDVTRVRGLEVTLDDGVTLVADAWHPTDTTAGPWPVLLQRLPYGRSVASTPVLAHPAWLARRGYAVVVQDCRGRGDSTGVFSPFVHEGLDGAASIEWAARLPFCDGRVATYGFSYQGLAQLYAAALRPPSLRAIAPMMCCPDPYDGWTYEGGALRWPFVCFWAAQLAGQDVGTGPVPFDVGALPRSGALGADPPAWFTEWLAHPDDDGYWHARRPDIGAIEVPAFTVGGWFDDFSSGTADLVGRLGADAILGPWAHMPWSTVHGGVDLGPAASPAFVADALVGFFDRVFDHPGRFPARPDEPVAEVRYFVLGAGTWRTAGSWPPPEVVVERWTAWSSSGNANSRWGDGVLAPPTRPVPGAGPAAADPAPARVPAPVPPSVLVVEPLVPYPGSGLGFQDESASEDRRDVLCFTSEPAPDATTIAGSPVVRVVVRADRPSHDVVVTLTMVDPTGRSRTLTGCATRVRPAGEPRPDPCTLELRLRPIAVEIGVGHRLRLDVSGGRFPCYDRNPHVADASPDTPAPDHVVATIEVWGAELDLPVLPSRGARAPVDHGTIRA